MNQARLYRPGDETGIVKLFKEVFGREMSLREWKWKYIESFPSKVYSTVIEDNEAGIVGHYGGISLPLFYRGRSARCLAICDVMIHPQFRGIKTLKELSSLVPREAVKDGIIMGYGFPTLDVLMRPALSLGIYEKVEDVREGSKGTGFHNDSTRYLLKFFPLDFKDERIDDLWDSCKQNMYLSVVRDMNHLGWRYRNHPRYQYELWGLRRRLGKKLLGIAVLKREDERVLLMDFLALKGMIKPLFQKIENYICSISQKALTLWFPPFLEEKMRSLGFSTKKAPTSIPRTTFKEALTREEMAGRFFYTMGDTDFL